MEMTTMQIDRAVVEQALEALKRLIGGSEYEEAIEAEQAITALRAALAQQAEPLNLADPAVQKRLATQWGYVPAAQAEPDLSRCPRCNGPADNGFDRSIPPSPYLCTKCMAEPVEPVATLIARRNDILRMAHEAGLCDANGEDDDSVNIAGQLVRFAALVAAAEREACAALLEANGMQCGEESLSRLILETNAAAIRARNNT